jgi:hypothetical protein
MRMKASVVLWLLCAVMVQLKPVAGAEAPEQFRARLATIPIDFTNRVNVKGDGSATASLAGNKLVVAGSFRGLSSPATNAQIHISTGPTGVRGPVAFTLTVSPATDGKLNGSFELSPTQAKQLKDGRFYITLKSEKAPDGNLWGWLLK